MRTEKRTTENVSRAKKRKEFFKSIGGSIAPNEALRFADGTVGRYAGIRSFETYGVSSVNLGCYGVVKVGEDDSSYRNVEVRDLPSEVIVGNKNYRMVLREVEKPSK